MRGEAAGTEGNRRPPPLRRVSFSFLGRRHKNAGEKSSIKERLRKACQTGVADKNFILVYGALSSLSVVFFGVFVVEASWTRPSEQRDGHTPRRGESGRQFFEVFKNIQIRTRGTNVEQRWRAGKPRRPAESAWREGNSPAEICDVLQCCF